jgi:hypothetical protein
LNLKKLADNFVQIYKRKDIDYVLNNILFHNLENLNKNIYNIDDINAICQTEICNYLNIDQQSNFYDVNQFTNYFFEIYCKDFNSSFSKLSEEKTNIINGCKKYFIQRIR